MAARAEDMKATLLVYQDVERGTEPFITRIMVTDTQMRMDYGADTDDFVLVDLAGNTLSNVIHDSQRAMMIDLRPVTGPSPLILNLEVKPGESADMPEVAGVQPEHHQFLVNGKVCEQRISLPGLFPEAVRAMGLFKRILAGQRAATVDATPVEMLDACDLALLTFHPEAGFKKGLPLRVWDQQGRLRQLVDFKADAPVDPALFTIPEGYAPFRISPTDS
ncbi:MAG: hypothetical protein ACPG4N_05535 [Gammaproteobacteria bacterium]